MNLAEPQGRLVDSKLPISFTVYFAYTSYIQHLPDLLRTSWLWLLVVGTTTAVAHGTEWNWVGSTLQMLAAASMAVAWHRLLIVGERPGFSSSNLASGNFWRYVRSAILLVAITLAPIFAVMFLSFAFLLSSKLSGAPPLSLLLMRLAVIAAIAISTCRIALVLPARAVANPNRPTLTEAWKRTRHNTWRLFWGVLVTSLPQLFATQLFAPPISDPSAVVGARNIAIGEIADATALSVSYLLALPVSIGFLSYAYLHFFKDSNGGPSPAVP
jgi:hypothetical protein